MKKLLYILPLFLITACGDNRQAELKDMIKEDPIPGFDDVAHDCVTGHMADNLSDEEYNGLIASKKDKSVKVEPAIQKSASMKIVDAVIVCGDKIENPSAEASRTIQGMKMMKGFSGFAN